MFDAGASGGSEHVDVNSLDSDKDNRRQYTVKGIENQTVALMRDAARKEGMKIGSWVSLRMKEAAERALSEEVVRPSTGTPSGGSKLQSAELSDLLEQLIVSVESLKAMSEDRFHYIERSLYDMTRSQMTIMTDLLSRR